MHVHDQPVTSHLLAGVRTIGLLVAVGFILHLNSERAYWFYSPEWFTTHIVDTLILTGFYGFAAGLAIWALGRTAYRGWHQVVLAGTVFAWTIEGAVVHVLHEAGPLDIIFPAMFAGWHGLLSFAGCLVLVRYLLVAGRVGALAVASGGYGLIVGSWAITSWLPDSDSLGNLVHADLGGIAEPGRFALTMGLVVASLAGAHLILDRIWNPAWRPSRVSTWMIGGATALMAAIGFFTVPYGPVRYAVLVALPLGALWISGRRSTGPNLFAVLGGRIRPWHVVALLPAALTASAVYLLAWQAGPDHTTLEAVRDLHVFAQIIAGGGVLAWSIPGAIRRGTRSPHNNNDTPAGRPAGSFSQPGHSASRVIQPVKAERGNSP